MVVSLRAAPRAFASVLLAGCAGLFGLALSGCSDPCVQLQERICNCEGDTNSRRACITDRITNQQGQVEVSDSDKAFCAEKLETCTCAALDQNDPDNVCGFAVDVDAAGAE